MPPVKPMLAKSVAKIPPGMHYEAKWDGFRAIVYRDGDEVELGSRTGKPLTRYFPELVVAVRERLPERCVVDGEIVIARDGHLDFDALTERIHPADSRVRTLAERTPASLVAFDLLALDDASLLDVGLADRRALLVRALSGVTPPVHVAPATDDIEVARRWFEQYEGAGLDGVVAKPLDLRYRQDERAMYKIKHERTADVVVAGYRFHKSGPVVGSLLLGLYDDRGLLQHVGVSAAFTMKRRAELVAELEPLRMDDARGIRGPPGPRRRRTSRRGCPARRAAGRARRTCPGCRCVPSGWSRWRTTTWRTGRASGTRPASAAGARTGPPRAAPTRSWRSRSATTWRRSSAGPDARGGPYGCIRTLTAPSCFFWNISYACGASASGIRWVAKPSTPSGSSSVRYGTISSLQRRTLAWPMRSWICLSNMVSIGMGSAMPPYTPDSEMVPPRRTRSIAV